MRTYFILAALMGVFAFGSISLLAHAQEDYEAARAAADGSAVPATEDSAAAPTDELPVEEEPTGPSPDDIKRDAADCKKEAYGRRSGKRDQRTQEDRDGQYLDCMSGRGYTSDEIDGSK